ncbi:AAA family ATPase [Sphingomonas sp. R647]|uniref:AAA family ATPase n=1 Tax=Sphingomonas sp. R647 TaxID=2875233 RepID=UPI001CD22258|nr:AAA family ATPase [Sphingomonas sp. R647]MCA1196553.1 AAA family ATPase [Sphingomonas sp. R647]
MSAKGRGLGGVIGMMISSEPRDAASVEAAATLRLHIDRLSARFVARRALLELVMLGLVAREHVLLIGPPGTGKSAAVQAVAGAIEANTFEYLLGRFTEPSELFGALDLNALKEGRVEPVTSGMLPQAEVAFLDEIFLGSTAILNTLLKILNERTYRRGQFSVTTPLISCIAASNALPEDTTLAAFADRFLLTMFVDPVGDGDLPALLRTGWRMNIEETDPPPPLNTSVIADLHRASLDIDMSEVTDLFAHVVRKMRLIGVPLSDRKIVKAQKLVAAAALLRGAKSAGPQDLWPVTYLVQDKAQQAEASELLHAELKESFNPVLVDSVAQATYGPTAHAAKLTEQATLLLEERPALATDRLHEIWLVRLETMLTRIDAAFAGDTLPQSLRVLRASIQSVLDAPTAPAASPETMSAASMSPHRDSVPPAANPVVAKVAPPSARPWEGNLPGRID